ncbi:hypothetical protein RhiirA1_530858 [Rhizophagus irregularis]|uniref:Uncharacterized protein n=2 Tax=Rhizophagus irregularis TaxID=588596 RepID=A0A2N0SBF9_9GLOM|nr:hypothetical protein RhiirA1_530858 [Rhizophagus irregularis]
MKKLLPKLNVNQKNPNENFVNPIIKKVIKDITSNMKDKDLTRLFENCCPKYLRYDSSLVLMLVKIVQERSLLLKFRVIHVQAELIISDSYANAYYASPKSRLPHPKNPWSNTSFKCYMGKKWELDPLVSFLKLSHNYWNIMEKQQLGTMQEFRNEAYKFS